MHSTQSWESLADKKVGIFGLGVEGMSSLRACNSLGIEPVLVDDSPNIDVGEGREVIAFDRGGLAKLIECDVVIKAPGISHYDQRIIALQDANVEIVGGLGLWMQKAPLDRVVCITGTKGKSTTTALVAHLISELGFRVFAGGNLGLAPFDPDVNPGDIDYWVIEVGSYQAVDFGAASHVIGVTSLSEDHLPWHRDDAELYYRNKLSICELPGAVTTVASAESAELVRHASLLGSHVHWVDRASVESDTWAEQFPLAGTHNLINAGIAVRILEELGVPGSQDQTRIAGAMASFVGLPHRLELVHTSGAVRFFDDGLATNALASSAALETFAGERIALIVGGQERGIDYTPLAHTIAQRRSPTGVFTIPDNGLRIGAVTRAGTAGSPHHHLVTVEDTIDLSTAVSRAFDWAQPDGLVLLSPAAPSFGVFKNYEERSQAFVAAAQRF